MVGCVANVAAGTISQRSTPRNHFPSLKLSPRACRSTRVPHSQHPLAAGHFLNLVPWAKRSVSTVATRVQSTDDVASSVVDDSVTVEITVAAALKFGMLLKICGSCASLGSWDPMSAPAMTWSEGDVWILKTQIPNDTVEAKCVAVSEDSESVEWESGENRVIKIPDGVSQEGVVHVRFQYGETEVVDIVTDRNSPEGISESAENAELGETGSPVDQEEGDSDPVQFTADGDASQAPTAEERVDSTTVIPEESSPDASSEGTALQTSPKDSNQQSVLNQETESENAVKETKPVPTSGDSPIPDPPREDVEQRQLSVNSEKTNQITWLATLGAVSLPIMFWSEYTLCRTGCGLPPGPEGLLGGAEGISYLVITGIFLWSLIQRLRPSSKSTGIPFLLETGSVLAIALGVFVLTSQVLTFGYIPSALPDQNCPAEPTSFSSLFNSLTVSLITAFTLN